MLSFADVERTGNLISEFEALCLVRDRLQGPLDGGEDAWFCWGSTEALILDHDLALSMRALTLGHLNDQIEAIRSRLLEMAVDAGGGEGGTCTP